MKAGAPMTQYATWAGYSGDARIWLALGLLAAAAAAVLVGLRLPLPVRATRPGPAGRAAMIVAWVASIVAFLVCATIYLRQYIHAYHLSAAAAAPKDRIAPITLTAVACPSTSRCIAVGGHTVAKVTLLHPKHHQGVVEHSGLES